MVKIKSSQKYVRKTVPSSFETGTCYVAYGVYVPSSSTYGNISLFLISKLICIIFGFHQICFNDTYTNADKCMHNYINKVHPTLVIWLGIIQFRTKHGSSSNAKLIEILLRILNNQTKTRYIRNNTYIMSCKLVTKKPNKLCLIFSVWTYFHFLLIWVYIWI